MLHKSIETIDSDELTHWLMACLKEIWVHLVDQLWHNLQHRRRNRASCGPQEQPSMERQQLACHTLIDGNDEPGDEVVEHDVVAWNQNADDGGGGV